MRSADNLMRLYFRSVGRNSKLLLNVPPTRDGLFHDRDVRALEAFDDKRRALFERDVLAGGRVARQRRQHAGRRTRCRRRQPLARAGGHDDGVAGGGAARPGDVRHPAARRGDRARPAHRQPSGRRVARRPLAHGGVGHDDRQRPAAQRAPTTASRIRVVVEFAYDAPALRRIAAYQSPEARA